MSKDVNSRKKRNGYPTVTVSPRYFDEEHRNTMRKIRTNYRNYDMALLRGRSTKHEFPDLEDE